MDKSILHTTPARRKRSAAYRGFTDNNNNNIRRASEYRRTQPTPTVIPKAPLFIPPSQRVHTINMNRPEHEL